MTDYDFGFPYGILGEPKKHMEPYMRERASKLAYDLINAFPFYLTEEGFDYWINIMHRLKRISQEGC